MTRLFALLSLMMASACIGDESVATYGGAGKVWVLSELDDVPFTASATLEFGEEGEITGQAPCNRYSTQQNTPYPWFKIDPIAATRRACPDLQAEGAYFRALGEMTLSEVTGGVLLLSNEAGRKMVFNAE